MNGLKSSKKTFPTSQKSIQMYFFEDTFGIFPITIGIVIWDLQQGILKLIAPKLGRLKNNITFAALFKENKWL